MNPWKSCKVYSAVNIVIRAACSTGDAVHGPPAGPVGEYVWHSRHGRPQPERGARDQDTLASDAAAVPAMSHQGKAEVQPFLVAPFTPGSAVVQVVWVVRAAK